MREAVYCATRNLYADMVPSIKSLIMNSSVDRVWLLIEDDTFPYELPDICKVMNVSGQTFFPKDGVNFKHPWTYIVIMRAALHRLFPATEKILSLDVDTFAGKDISDIWDTDLDGYYLAACREPHKSTDGADYINCGVMLMNLDKLRDGKGDEIIEALNTKSYPFNEQDCINQLCKGQIKVISSNYNVNPWTEPPTDTKVVHFAAIKRYQTQAIYQLFARMRWSEVFENRLRPERV